MKTGITILLGILIILSSCSKEELLTSNNNSSDAWLVDVNDIIHFNSEKDRIQAVDSPEFLPISNLNIDAEMKVFAYRYDDVVHIYPKSAVQTHEIVNDSIGDHYFSISHCPLTASSLVWNRFLNGRVNSFGVSGMLYKENLIPYDRNTGSHWSQMLALGINGEFIGEEAQTALLLLTKFSTIERSFPNASIMVHTNCDSVSCSIDFKSVADEPVGGEGSSEIDDAEKYFGIIEGNRAELIPLSGIEDSIVVKPLLAFNKKMVFVSSNELDLQIVFESGPRTLSPVQNNLPIIMKDEQGNKYDIFGFVVEGPSKGKRLSSPTSYGANTYAWKDLFVSLEIVELK